MDSAETKEIEALSLTSPRINFLLGALVANDAWMREVLTMLAAGGTFEIHARGIQQTYTFKECQFVVAHLMTIGYVRIAQPLG